jgi:hypothetical protein
MWPTVPGERDRYLDLLRFFSAAPPPPDPHGLYPRFRDLQATLRGALKGDDEIAIEEALLALYCHVHGTEAPYTPRERRRVDETGGYWCHAGGLSPILRAGPFLRPDSVSMDLGAGNGLQGILLQRLSPHRRTLQVEISSRMVEAGRALADWAGVPPERLEWRIEDLTGTRIDGVDFLYLYRPVRPTDEGRRFYERLARDLAAAARPVTVFSVADCLREFLPPTVRLLHTDGHLTCYAAGPGGGSVTVTVVSPPGTGR